MKLKLDFFELDALQKELQTLPDLHRLAFSASMCERMLPNYVAYHRSEDWDTKTPPNINSLRNMLDKIWDFIQGEKLTENEICTFIKNCDNLIQDGDSTMSEYYTEGTNTVDLICNTLRACLQPTVENIIKIVKTVELTFADFIISEEETLDPNWWKRSFTQKKIYVSNHSLTIREREKQRDDLQLLKSKKILDKNFIQLLRHSFDNAEKSILNLP